MKASDFYQNGRSYRRRAIDVSNDGDVLLIAIMLTIKIPSIERQRPRAERARERGGRGGRWGAQFLVVGQHTLFTQSVSQVYPFTHARWSVAARFGLLGAGVRRFWRSPAPVEPSLETVDESSDLRRHVQLGGGTIAYSEFLNVEAFMGRVGIRRLPCPSSSPPPIGCEKPRKLFILHYPSGTILHRPLSEALRRPESLREPGVVG